MIGLGAAGCVLLDAPDELTSTPWWRAYVVVSEQGEHTRVLSIAGRADRVTSVDVTVKTLARCLQLADPIWHSE